METDIVSARSPFVTVRRAIPPIKHGPKAETRKQAAQMPDFSDALARLRRALVAHMRRDFSKAFAWRACLRREGTYQTDLHYMRGPARLGTPNTIISRAPYFCRPSSASHNDRRQIRESRQLSPRGGSPPITGKAEPMPDLEDELLILLSEVARHVRTYGNQLAQQHGVTLAQIAILERLDGESDISQNELAAIMELSPMTVARLVDRLEELDLIKRCADPEDRRMWRLQLTPAAVPLLRDVKMLQAKLFLVATKGINAGVLGTMARGLRQMKENVTSQSVAEYA
jgi:MarR family transcriptional regulator, transcriptional regulator for hemolysin